MRQLDVRSRAAEIRSLLEQVADVDFRHPAWWLAVNATAALEGLGGTIDDRRSFYLDGSLHADTFMARYSRRRSHGVDAIADAVIRARALVAAISELDGTLPGQPLGCVLERHGRWMNRVALSTHPPRIAFVTPVGNFLAVLGERADADPALCFDLAQVISGRTIRTGQVAPLGHSATPTPAIGVVSLVPESPGEACHLHRRVWSAGGGPWVGVGLAPPYEVVTTTHLAIDGFGHALLAESVFRKEDAVSAERRAALCREAARGQGAQCEFMERGSNSSGFGIATLELPVMPSFASAAYALGRTLEPFARSGWPAPLRRRAHFSPTFHVPVAPGQREDPERRRRRVVPGLLSLRMKEGTFEPFESFRARLPALLLRECAQEGVLTRMARASLRAPLPTAAKRWIVAGGPPRPWLPLFETLCGRGCLSLLRFPPGERPRQALFAVSSPALHDTDIGAMVLTLVESDDGCALTLGGTGRADSDRTARGWLDRFVAELV